MWQERERARPGACVLVSVTCEGVEARATCSSANSQTRGTCWRACSSATVAGVRPIALHAATTTETGTMLQRFTRALASMSATNGLKAPMRSLTSSAVSRSGVAERCTTSTASSNELRSNTAWKAPVVRCATGEMRWVASEDRNKR